jgi:hypothetical protein
MRFSCCIVPEDSVLLAYNATPSGNHSSWHFKGTWCLHFLGLEVFNTLDFWRRMLRGFGMKGNYYRVMRLYTPEERSPQIWDSVISCTTFMVCRSRFTHIYLAIWFIAYVWSHITRICTCQFTTAIANHSSWNSVPNCDNR